MKRAIATLTLFAALLYGMTAYTRPNEPAGKWLHGTAIPAVKEALPDCPRIPFSGLMQLNGYQHRPTGGQLEVVPATDTPYTPEELSEIYKSY